MPDAHHVERSNRNRTVFRLCYPVPAGLAAVMIAALTLGMPDNAAGQQTTLSPGTSIAAAIQNNPSGSTFVLECGTYRFTDVGDGTLIPLQGDSFIGVGIIGGVPSSPPCADLNGAVMLGGWTRGSGASAGTWYTIVSSADVINSHGPRGATPAI